MPHQEQLKYTDKARWWQAEGEIWYKSGMLVFLSKFLPLFVYPAGLACTLLALGLVMRGHKRLQTSLMAAALAVILICGNRWVAVSLVRSLEWRYLPPAQMPSAPAIVLLGGGTDAPLPPRPGVEVNAAGDRVIYAARLYHAGKAAHLLISGGAIAWQGPRTTTPADDMAELLGELGVPQQALWLQGRSQNTYEDALYSSQMLKERGITQVILVTSAQHMPRSVILFEKQGIQVIPAPCDYSVTLADWEALIHPNLPTFLINLAPSDSNLRATSGALKEYLGMAVYALAGWTPGD
ncbi:MAG: YdcF family protein [Anaerolineaceae bacterium]|nr:YdcF family protein [Anaerolineaceae bacterium]